MSFLLRTRGFATTVSYCKRGGGGGRDDKYTRRLVGYDVCVTCKHERVDFCIRYWFWPRAPYTADNDNATMEYCARAYNDIVIRAVYAVIDDVGRGRSSESRSEIRNASAVRSRNFSVPTAGDSDLPVLPARGLRTKPDVRYLMTVRSVPLVVPYVVINDLSYAVGALFYGIRPKKTSHVARFVVYFARLKLGKSATECCRVNFVRVASKSMT